MISANAVLPMCLVMALGYGTRRLGWIRREEISAINKIAFRIFLPCLLYYNVYCSDLSGSFDPLLMAYAVGGVLLTFGLSLGYTLLTEKLPERRGVMIQGMFRSNYVIMGIPVATALLGSDQLGTVSILIAVVVPLFNMLSVVVLEVFRGQKPKPLHILGQIAKNPLVIGSVLGILTLAAGIRLPHILEQTIQNISAIASPLQLFLLGAFFQFSGLKTYRRELVTVSDGRRCRARRRHRGHHLGREYSDHVFVDLSVQISWRVLSAGGFPNWANRRIIPYSDNESIKRAKP